jgi:hypothetical protein
VEYELQTQNHNALLGLPQFTPPFLLCTFTGKEDYSDFYQQQIKCETLCKVCANEKKHTTLIT